MTHGENSFKGVIYGTTIGVIKGDTWSLDYGSYGLQRLQGKGHLKLMQGWLLGAPLM